MTPSGEGLEAAAREARYAALDEAADRHEAVAVLLGHTLDDQAEQVLLGLTRGAGARSLSGMPATRGRFRRPLLGVRREQCRASVRTQGLSWWDDPMNDDPAFTRVRARRALADLERDLGPGVAAALARTASLLRDDADHLDALADAAVTTLGPQPWPVGELTGIPRAVRTRVWRRLLIAAGAPAGQVGARHTDACDRLLTAWHGQGPVHAPGDLRVGRSGRVWSPSAPPIRLTRHHHPPAPHPPGAAVDAAHMGADLERVLITEEEIQARLGELADVIATEYAGKDLLLVGVLKGAVMVMADLMRALPITVPVDWMAVSSYGSGTKSSGVVRILKDLDSDITGRHVLIVEDIVDSGLTLSWIKSNLESRSPASRSRSARCCASRMPRRSRSTSGGSGSTSPTSSSSATASTTPRPTAACGSSARSPRTSTADVRRAGARRDSGRSPFVAEHGDDGARC